MKESIGAYFELQLAAGQDYYPTLIKLNTSRNALEYILRLKGYKKVFLPYFTCDVMLEPVQKLGLQHQFYSIDKNLDPIIDFEIGPKDCFVYTNYFGVKNKTVEGLSSVIPNLVIDNAQSFFSTPIEGVDTIYSCRKFFGVSDGAYLSTTSNERLDIPKDYSYSRISHLIKRTELKAEEGYREYVDNDNSLKNNDIRSMSLFTEKVMAGIDYHTCQQIRNQNFQYLHQHFAGINELNIDGDSNAPMIYPLLISKDGIKKELISQRIFIATYWPNVFDWTNESMFENFLAKHLLSLPIDHRYNLAHMQQLVSTVKQLI